MSNAKDEWVSGVVDSFPLMLGQELASSEGQDFKTK